MSIQDTFNTAVQGMLTNSHALSVISTNVANVNTTGYKAETSNFETLLSASTPNGSSWGANSVAGNVTPGTTQFLSVNAVDTQNVALQGQIQTTNNNMDLAINGTGFFITNTAQDGSGSWQYTRDGAFQGQAITLSTSTNGSGAPDQGTLLTTTGGAYVYGWPVNADGTFTQTNNLSSLQPVMVSNDAELPAQATSNVALQANVPNAMSGRQSVTLPYIDENGVQQTLTMGVTATVNAGYNLDFTASDGSPVTATVSNLSFNSAAQLAVPAGGQMQVTVNEAGGPQTINLDLSKMTDYASGTSGGITVENVSQDGYISGTLNNTTFDSQGVLSGTYSNGITKPLYQLPVATFPAQDNLNAMPGNYFLQSASSGPPTIQGLSTEEASAGGTAFIPGALESSNVDLTSQFSNMIITQRAYSSNAQVLQTADQMTQAVRDLIS